MQGNFTIHPMSAENIRECADLFMRTFSKEPWNDVYESGEQVILFSDTWTTTTLRGIS